MLKRRKKIAYAIVAFIVALTVGLIIGIYSVVINGIVEKNVINTSSEIATVGDMALNVEQTQLPYSVICEGKKMGRNIQRCNLDEDKVQSLIDKYGFKQEEVLLLLVTGGDSFYLQPRSGKFITGKISEEVG